MLLGLGLGSNFRHFPGGGGHAPRPPQEALAYTPLVYKGGHLLSHENPPTSKLNETVSSLLMVIN